VLGVNTVFTVTPEDVIRGLSSGDRRMVIEVLRGGQRVALRFRV
jgi:hypothetical protein